MAEAEENTTRQRRRRGTGMTALAWFGSALLGALGGLFLVAAIVLALLQIPEIRQAGFTRALQDVQSEDLKIAVDGVSGSWPADLKVDRIEIGDATGTWLIVEKLALAWRPLSLVGGRLEIDALTADAVRLARLPEGQDEEPPADDQPFSLPAAPLAIDLHELDVGEVEVAEAAFGQAVTAKLGGSAHWELDDLTAKLDLIRTDGQPGTLTLDGSYLSGGDEIALKAALLDGSSEHKAVLADLLDLKDASPVDLTADINTNGDKIAGHILATAGTALDASLRIGGEWGERRSASIVAQAKGTLVSENLEPIQAREARLQTQVAMPDDNDLSLSNFVLDAGPLNLSANLDLKGLDASLPSSILASGKLSGAENLANDALRQLLSELDFEIRAVGSEASPKIEVQTLTVSNAAADISATGTVDREAQRFDGSATATLAELAVLEPLFQPSLSGKATVTADSIAMNFDGYGTASATVRAENFGSSEETVANALGKDWTLKAAVERAESGALSVNPLNLARADGKLDVSGQVAISASQALDGRVTLTSPDLAAVLPSASISGTTEATATLSGTLSKPEARLKSTLANGQIGDLPYRTLKLEGTVIPGGSGPIRLDLRTPRGDALIEAKLGLPDSGAILLDDLTGSLWGAPLKGNATVRPDGLVEARLESTDMPLGPVGALAELTMNGKSDLTLTMTPVSGRQNATVDLSLERLIMEQPVSAGLRSASLSAELTDLSGKPSVDADFRANRLAVNEFFFPEATVSAKGSLGKLAIAVNADGRRDGAEEQDAEVRLAATADLDGPVEVDLTDLMLGLEHTEVTLGAPARITSDRGTTTLSGLDLKVAHASNSGDIKGDLTIEPSDATGSLRLANIPVAIFSDLLREAEAGGTLDGEIRLATATGDSRIDLDFSEIQLSEAYAGSVPPFDASIKAAAGRRDLTLEARAQGVSEKPFLLTARLPIRKTAASPFPEPVESEPFDARFTWQGPLETLGALIAIETQHVEGRVTADLRASGVLAEPEFAGSVQIEDGRYENYDTGTILTDITLNVRGNGTDQMDFALSANDTGTGRLDGKGEIHFDDDVEVPVNIEFNFSDLLVANMTEARLKMNGNLSATSTGFPPTRSKPLKIEGKLATPTAEFRIPDQFGVSFPEVEVTIVGIDPVQEIEGAENDPVRIELNVDVDVGGPARISGRGLNSFWEGTVMARGTAEKPLLYGDVTSRRGTLEFAGKTLKLEESTVRFEGRSPPDPQLDVTLSYERTDFSATISVSGKSSDPEIKLASTPQLPEDEVLARILFDKGVSELSAIEAAQLAATLAELSGQGSGLDLMGSIQEAIGLDVLRVDSADGGGATITAGKYVAEGVYVGVAQGTNTGATTATVEIEVTPQITVDTEIGQDASSGGGINWRWTY